MKLRTLTATLAALALAFTSLSARAADPKPAPVMRASVSSLDDVKKLLADLAIPLPFPLDPKAMIERQFKFIGPGGIQGDKPFGVLVIGGDNLKPQEQAISLFPVVPTAATLESFTTTGATPVDGHADMVAMPGMGGTINFRRTANYLLMYPGAADLLAAVDEATIARDYAKPGHLATVSVDLAAFRAAAPEKYKAIWEQAKQPKSNDPAQIAGQQWAQESMQAAADKLDRVTLAFGRDDNAVHLELWVMPIEFKEARKFPRPAFPAGTVAQMHLVRPDSGAATAAKLTALLDKLPADKFGNGKFTPEQSQRFIALGHRVANLLLAADAQSFAVEITNGAPVVYVVNQYAADIDTAAELAAIVKEFNALGHESGEGDVLGLTSYPTAAGKTVSRVTIIDHGTPKGYVDLLQQARVVTIAIAPEDGKHVEAVAALPPSGEFSNLCTGSIDLANALKAAESSGQPLPLPEPQLAQLRQAFAGQSITWVAKGDVKGKFLYTSLDIPTVFIKQAGQIFGGMMQQRGPNRMGPGGPGGPGGPPMGPNPGGMP